MILRIKKPVQVIVTFFVLLVTPAHSLATENRSVFSLLTGSSENLMASDVLAAAKAPNSANNMETLFIAGGIMQGIHAHLQFAGMECPPDLNSAPENVASTEPTDKNSEFTFFTAARVFLWRNCLSANGLSREYFEKTIVDQLIPLGEAL